MRTGSVKPNNAAAKGSVSTAKPPRHWSLSAALAGILLLAFFVTSGSYFPPIVRPAKCRVEDRASVASRAGGEAAHRVASIVVETDKKGRCEERRFDNRTGKIVASNFVDCDARLAAGTRRDAVGSNLSAERMRAILGAFKR